MSKNSDNVILNLEHLTKLPDDIREMLWKTYDIFIRRTEFFKEAQIEPIYFESDIVFQSAKNTLEFYDFFITERKAKLKSMLEDI